MNKTAIVTLACSLLFLCSDARSQVFYQYPEAPIVKAGEVAIGPYFAVGESELFRIGGFVRMNATKHIDVGFELLGDLIEGNGRGGLGADAKLSIFSSYKAIPFDLSVTGGIGYVTGNDTKIIQAPVGAIISSPFKLERGNILVPYLGVYLLIVNTEFDHPSLPDDSDTDFDAELRGGLRYTLSAGPDIFVAGHVGRGEKVLVGVSFWPRGRD
ncbi:MAG: hypothetical protein JSW58_05280 [Candidatus Latescibacterota bacterium]|nr:MAG: hypothetical protein JSW58_05280 [Candidatus Latescibacterota bacterium]